MLWCASAQQGTVRPSPPPGGRSNSAWLGVPVRPGCREAPAGRGEPAAWRHRPVLQQQPHHVHREVPPAEPAVHGEGVPRGAAGQSQKSFGRGSGAWAKKVQFHRTELLGKWLVYRTEWTKCRPRFDSWYALSHKMAFLKRLPCFGCFLLFCFFLFGSILNCKNCANHCIF